MIFDWYKIFNLTEFTALALVSKEYVVNPEGIGEKTVLVTKGNYTSILYDDVFLPILMVDENPFEMDDVAVWKDVATNDIYLGINPRES